MHNESLLFLKDALTDATDSKSIVVATHHVPTFLNYPEKYKGDLLNEAFASELSDLIESKNLIVKIIGAMQCI